MMLFPINPRFLKTSHPCAPSLASASIATNFGGTISQNSPMKRAHRAFV